MQSQRDLVLAAVMRDNQKDVTPIRASVLAGCCLASSKEDCRRPPCPCNMEAWTRDEVSQLRAKRRKAAA